MDNKALFNLSYGVFVLSTESNGKLNACITNTCIQVASEPVRVAISILNSNHTCSMVKESGLFALSILDKDCTFDTIKHFGFQSGKNVNKFENFEYETDKNGCPYLKSQVCSLISCKVISSQDLGSHTLFIAEVEDAKLLSDKKPITYSDYQNEIKPKQEINKNKKIVAWRCKICGYVYNNPELPPDYVCPLCGHPASDFEPIYE